MLFLRRIVALAAAFVLSSAAQAIPIVYEFSGTVSSGSLNGVSFADRGFTVNVFGDTSGVTNAGGLFMNAASAVTFPIAGVGSGSLTQNYRMFLDPALATGLSRLPSGDDRINLLAHAAAFGADALASEFAPISAGPASRFIGQFLPDPTAAGPPDRVVGAVLERDVSSVSSRNANSGAGIMAAGCAGIFGGCLPAPRSAPGKSRSRD